MLYFYLSYAALIIMINIYFKKKKLLPNYTGDHHQLFSNTKNVPLLGGVFLNGYHGGSGLTSGAVFGRNAGYSAALENWYD